MSSDPPLVGPSVFGRLGPYKNAIIAANGIFFVAAVVLLWTSWLFAGGWQLDGRAFAQNVLLCLFGAVLGWGTGILATPIRREDSARFERLGKLISAFLTGYIVSKLDRFLELALYHENALVPVAWERAGLVATSFLTMLIVVFINRSYLHGIHYDEPHVPADRDGA